VEPDARLGLRVPAELAFGDDVEQVVQREALVGGVVEMVGGDGALQAAVTCPPRARKRRGCRP
jgi:hypothetical protein